MTQDSIKDQITGYLSRFFPVHDVADDDDLFALGFVNSMFAIQLVTFVESEFAITVENDDLEIRNFSSIGGLVDFVGRKVSVAEPVAL